LYAQCSCPRRQALINGYLSESTFDHVTNVFVDCDLNTLDSASASKTPEAQVRQPTGWIKVKRRGRFLVKAATRQTGTDSSVMDYEPNRWFGYRLCQLQTALICSSEVIYLLTPLIASPGRSRRNRAGVTGILGRPGGAAILSL
jgi:hypothetical protein